MPPAKPKSSTPGEPPREKPRPRTKYQHPDAARETIESLVVAFILAFLFRTFEAEAFVIPTGSMAETLNGRHKEVTCEECGWHYHIGASQEIDDEAGLLISSHRLKGSSCPNCRHENSVAELPVFHGDRILVNKFSYELSSPRRWDVFVFKYPEGATRNYIKRLVGLPGEYLKIERGDLYARLDEKAEWKIQRKDNPEKQRLQQMIVYDNDHPETRLLAAGWPERWAAVENRLEELDDDGTTPDPAGWKSDPAARSFSLSRDASAAGSPRWIRYRNYVPNRSSWEAVLADPTVRLRSEPSLELITDRCGYNSGSTFVPFRARKPDDFAPPESRDDIYWVGDLAFSCTVNVTEVGDGGALTVALTEGVRDYLCRIDLTTGLATLTLHDHVFHTHRELDQAATSLTGAGTYRLTFANVDDRLCLWIDDRLVEFANRGEYDPPTSTSPTRRDLAPAAIGGESAALTVSRLRVERDIYYRADVSQNELEYSPHRRNGNNDFITGPPLVDLLDDPEAYGEAYAKYAQPVVYPRLKDDEYFALGDNSPASNDSRLWTRSKTIPRHALLGKAFFIYWPHGVPFLNDGHGYPMTYHQYNAANRFNAPPDIRTTDYPNLRFPFYPNIPRMERIR